MKTITLNTKIEKESEKAIMIDCGCLSSYGSEFSYKMWLPKSQVTINETEVIVPKWLLAAKLQEPKSTLFIIGNQTFRKIDFI